MASTPRNGVADLNLDDDDSISDSISESERSASTDDQTLTMSCPRSAQLHETCRASSCIPAA